MWVFERKGRWYKHEEVIRTVMCVFEWFVVMLAELMVVLVMSARLAVPRDDGWVG
jgi:hypothetical protein